MDEQVDVIEDPIADCIIENPLLLHTILTQSSRDKSKRDASSQNKVKRVQFAERPIIYKSTPFPRSSVGVLSNVDMDEIDLSYINAMESSLNGINGNVSIGYLDTDFLINEMPKQSCLKNNEFTLRTPVDAENQVTFGSIAVLLLSLSLLFFLIWWTVNKLLMVEIESQVGDHVMDKVVRAAHALKRL
ncbi:hypothetical protein TRFO_39264 [Tritrichomonas foetus]|uniref:Uncharacterized protein n=1 Tax=Tritrichomonas foetus TaxID=1144522 RepID=A0A1J4JA94_9EUKA|nr:hypothetical protein TRFO_39264 [Tritrichomonas foetus]|eukprot:OHS94555.1 hypothetical protein TRFO_39264 [Tritrichomonas foetus]